MGSRTGTFHENYAQDMAIFHSGLQWGIVVAFLVLLFACPLFCSDRILTILTMMGIAVISVHGLNILTGYCGQISIGHAGFMAVGRLYLGHLVRQARRAVLGGPPLRRPRRGNRGSDLRPPVPEDQGLLSHHGDHRRTLHHHLDHHPAPQHHRRDGRPERAQTCDREYLARLQDQLFLRGDGFYLPGHAPGQEHRADPGRQGLHRHPGQRPGGGGHGDQSLELQAAGLFHRLCLCRGGRGTAHSLLSASPASTSFPSWIPSGIWGC